MHLIRHGERYAAVILSAPMYDFFTGPVPRRLAAFLSRHLCSRGRAEEYAYGQGDYKIFQGIFTPVNFITSDRRRYAIFHDAFRDRPELRVGGVSFGWIKAALRACDHIQNEAPLEGVKTPVLILSAPEDRVVRSIAHRRVAERLGNATLRSYPDAKHELLMERDDIRDRVWADIDRFLAAVPL
jgi:lysophospholipase